LKFVCSAGNERDVSPDAGNDDKDDTAEHPQPNPSPPWRLPIRH
jgi:hypothetical protein